MYGAAPQIGEIKASATRQTPDESRRNTQSWMNERYGDTTPTIFLDVLQAQFYGCNYLHLDRATATEQNRSHVLGTLSLWIWQQSLSNLTPWPEGQDLRGCRR
jgi:hypothetical protein